MQNYNQYNPLILRIIRISVPLFVFLNHIQVKRNKCYSGLAPPHDVAHTPFPALPPSYKMFAAALVTHCI